jgi:hypothetical protein
LRQLPVMASNETCIIMRYHHKEWIASIMECLDIPIISVQTG